MIEILAFISIFAESDSDSTVALLLAGPASGIAFFAWVYRRYRNVDKRHEYEHSPNVKSAVTKVEDNYLGRRERQRHSEIRRRNSGMPTWRIGTEMPPELKVSKVVKMFSRKR